MQAIKIRLLTLIIVLMISGLMTVGLWSRGKHAPGTNESNLSHFPLNHKGWIGEKITMEQKVYDILETDALVLNRYVKEGKSVVLAIVYYPDTRVGFHGPDSCYGGAGVRIDKEVQEVIVKESGPMTINVLTVDRGNARELVYYFFKSGKFVGDNYAKLRYNLIKNNLLSEKKGGALVRISTPITNDMEKTSSNLLVFLNDFMPVFQSYM